MSIFNSIIEEAKGKQRNNDWFRDQLFTKLDTIGESDNPDDDSDESNGVEGGELYFFSYSAKFPERYPYYDVFPLVYVINTYEDGFLGCNLHYLSPNNRKAFAKSLINRGDGIVVPDKTIHKYLFERILSNITKIPSSEYEGISILPIEKFVNRLGVSVPSRKIWRS